MYYFLLIIHGGILAIWGIAFFGGGGIICGLMGKVWGVGPRYGVLWWLDVNLVSGFLERCDDSGFDN